MTDIVNGKITLPIYKNATDVHVGSIVTVITKDGVLCVDLPVADELILGKVVKLLAEVEVAKH